MDFESGWGDWLAAIGTHPNERLLAPGLPGLGGMDTEFKQESDAPETLSDAADVNISVEEAGSIAMTENQSPDTSAQFEQVTDKISKLLADLPAYVSGFFSEYQRPLTTLLLLFGAIIAAKLTLALLGALNEIPLLAPTFELVGFGYAAWFVYRYLWQATSRQELVEDFSKLKNQVLGNGGE